MSLLGRKKEPQGASVTSAPDATEPASPDPDTARKITAPKGRPTPKRDAARRRGPVAPAPMTAAEARRRRKAMRSSMSREERRAERAERRQQTSDRRERMMAGEEGYLLPRDQGPIRRYVRDMVDARRNVLGLFMPAALALIFIMLAVPQVQYYISPAMLVLVVLMAIDGLILARKVNKLVDIKFPKNDESRWKLGFYAASRASQLRRMRAPRPRVNRGDAVA